jgi:hypothetical protein
MKLLWTLAAVAGLIAGPVCAQGLIPPSRQYLTPKREGLDKSYGLPTFGTPSESMPKQQATALPKQEPPATPFTGLSTFARPDASPSDAPDFFQKPSGLASSETGVPNFFEGTQDAGRPKVGAARTGETPLYTTDEGDTTGGDTTVGKTPAAAASDD